MNITEGYIDHICNAAGTLTQSYLSCKDQQGINTLVQGGVYGNHIQIAILQDISVLLLIARNGITGLVRFEQILTSLHLIDYSLPANIHNVIIVDGIELVTPRLT